MQYAQQDYQIHNPEYLNENIYNKYVHIFDSYIQ